MSQLFALSLKSISFYRQCLKMNNSCQKERPCILLRRKTYCSLMNFLTKVIYCEILPWFEIKLTQYPWLLNKIISWNHEISLSALLISQKKCEQAPFNWNSRWQDTLNVNFTFFSVKKKCTQFLAEVKRFKAWQFLKVAEFLLFMKRRWDNDLSPFPHDKNKQSPH